MRLVPILTILALAAGPGHAEEKMVTTTVRNGTSVSSVRQSGDPATASKRVEKRPGYTRIEQHSGGNHSVVIQSTDPADLGQVPGLERLPKELRDLLGWPDPTKP